VGASPLTDTFAGIHPALQATGAAGARALFRRLLPKLETGNWKLETGDWRLATGHWPLAYGAIV